jgi:hypothetical protein
MNTSFISIKAKEEEDIKRNHPCCKMNTNFISIKGKEEEDIERNHPCCTMNTSFISIKAKEPEDIERKNGELWFAGTTNSCGFPCQNCMKVPLITMLGGRGENS